MRIRRSSRSLAQWVFPTEFKDKEDLFVESLRRYFDTLMARGHLLRVFSRSAMGVGGRRAASQ